MRNVLVLGIGNILKSDEGLGVYIVNYMKESDIQLPDGVELIDGGTAGFDLLSIMKNREKIVIVDALNMDDSPGNIYRFTPDDAIDYRSTASLHEIGIIEVIKVLRLLGSNPEIEIIGVVPADINSLDISISEAVRKSVPHVVKHILDAVAN